MCNDIGTRATLILDELRARVKIPAEDRETALDESQTLYLLDLGVARQPQHVLEIGLGWGFSAAAIQCFGSVKRHLIVELEEGSSRATQGERNVRSMSADQRTIQIFWGDSNLVLPRLCEAGESFDLVLIDGGHRYDEVFVDFHFIRRLVKPGALVLLDDVWMPSVQTVVSWIETNLSSQWLRIPTPKDFNFCVFESRGLPDQRRWHQFTPFEVSTRADGPRLPLAPV